MPYPRMYPRMRISCSNGGVQLTMIDVVCGRACNDDGSPGTTVSGKSRHNADINTSHPYACSNYSFFYKIMHNSKAMFINRLGII